MSEPLATPNPRACTLISICRNCEALLLPDACTIPIWDRQSKPVASLFRATEFPHSWQKYRDLLPGFPGVDPTLFRHAGKWWLFVTYGVYPCNENNLHLFVADSLDDQFVAHPMNPIKVGLRGSRMAGGVCELDGKLVRPGQDGSDRYGGGVVIFEILQLDERVYAEREVVGWHADSQGEFNRAFHSFAVTRDLIAIDGERYLPLACSESRQPVNSGGSARPNTA